MMSFLSRTQAFNPAVARARFLGAVGPHMETSLFLSDAAKASCRELLPAVEAGGRPLQDLVCALGDGLRDDYIWRVLARKADWAKTLKDQPLNVHCPNLRGFVPVAEFYRSREIPDYWMNYTSLDFQILARLGILIFVSDHPMAVDDLRGGGTFFSYESVNLHLPEFRFFMDFFSREDEGPPVELVPTLASSSDDEYANMVAADAHPLLFSLSGSLYLHGGHLHPYMALLHDFYHVALTQLLEKNLRTVRVAVYQAVKNLQDRYRSQSQMNEVALGLAVGKSIFSNYTSFQNELLELDLPQTIRMHELRWKGLFAFVKTSPPLVRAAILPDLANELSKQLEGHPLKDVVLNALVGETGLAITESGQYFWPLSRG